MEIKNVFLSRLREETMPLHKEVEASAISRAIVSPAVTKEEYINYLNRVLAIHTDVEASVFPVISDIVTDLASRKKTPFIQNDLADLNQPVALAGGRFLDSGYDNSSIAFSMGLMYVTEGSTLGGQFILKNIRAALGNDAPAGFLNVYSEKTGTLWKGFLATLQSYEAGLNDAGKDNIIAGAVYGFERVKYIFN